jgi:chromate reductase, NAD(P)H dehydrogenase (quinone)
MSDAETIELLLISGSLRSGSTNTALLRTVERLAPNGLRATLYDGLGELPHFDPDLDRDPLPLPVASLRAAIRSADALLFCTPEYAGALPGSFKNLLDWTIGDDQPGSIYRKPVAWINVSSSATGAADAHESLGKVLNYAHADVLTEACVHIPVARDMIGPDGVVQDPVVRTRIAEALAALVASSSTLIPGSQCCPR